MTEKEKKVLLLNEIIEAHESGLIQWYEQKGCSFWKADFKDIKMALFAREVDDISKLNCTLRFLNDSDNLTDLHFDSRDYPELITKVLSTLITLPTGKKLSELDLYLDKIGKFQTIRRGEIIEEILDNSDVQVYDKPNNQQLNDCSSSYNRMYTSILQSKIFCFFRSYLRFSSNSRSY